MIRDFVVNEAEKGGGLYLQDQTGDISHVTLLSNEADKKGGGLYIEGGSNIVRNITLQNNEASSFGGAIYIDSQSDIVVLNNIQKLQ